MKTRISTLMLFFYLNFFGQGGCNTPPDSLKTTLFSLTPRIKKTNKINGLAMGLGLNAILNEKSSIKKVNGINLEVNPISVLVALFLPPRRMSWDFKPESVINGLNISTGNPNMSTINGGLIAGFNISYATNGISLSGFYNYSKIMNGLHISGLATVSEKANGLFIAATNNTENLNGIQLGVINESINSKGIQLGLYNKAKCHVGLQIGIYNTLKTRRGLQLGFWNSNGKRALPFINF